MFCHRHVRRDGSNVTYRARICLKMCVCFFFYTMEMEHQQVSQCGSIFSNNEIFKFCVNYRAFVEDIFSLPERYKRKSLLQRIVSADEKWIYFDNVSGKNSWINAGAVSTSTVRLNRFERKTILYPWWDQKCVVLYRYNSLVKRLEPNVCQHQLINRMNRSLLKRLTKYQKPQHKMIILLDLSIAKSILVYSETNSQCVGNPELRTIPCGLLTQFGPFTACLHR